MRKQTNPFLRRPKLLIVIGVLLAIILCVLFFQKPMMISLHAKTPWQNALTIKNFVAMPIENHISTLKHVETFSSTCDNEGNYILSIIFDASANKDSALIDVQNAMANLAPRLNPIMMKNGIKIQRHSRSILGNIYGDTQTLFCQLVLEEETPPNEPEKRIDETIPLMTSKKDEAIL